MLREHVVGTEILLPGVGYVELALASMLKREALQYLGLALVETAFVRPCVISSACDTLT